ncbi:MAG: hypothetical protein ACLGIB_02955 [Actinomycetota bacterium]
MSVTFNYQGDWFRARIRYEISDEGSTARDAYLGHREGDRSSAMNSLARVNQGSIPPRHRARFLAPAPEVTTSFCRTTGDWYAECVAHRWRVNVIAEVWVGGNEVPFPFPNVLIDDVLAKAQGLLREGVEYLETI